MVSALGTDGLHFQVDPAYRLESRQAKYDSNSITAAEVFPPADSDQRWTMFYSAWLDAVQAEDMSRIGRDNGAYRMYYAACDKHGHWRIASAVKCPET